MKDLPKASLNCIPNTRRNSIDAPANEWMIPYTLRSTNKHNLDFGNNNNNNNNVILSELLVDEKIKL